MPRISRPIWPFLTPIHFLFFIFYILHICTYIHTYRLFKRKNIYTPLRASLGCLWLLRIWPIKYIRRKYRAIALWHRAYSEFRAKVHSEKGLYVQSIHSRFGANIGWQLWNSVFPKIPPKFYVDVHIFGRNCTCVRSRKKNLLLHISLYFIWMPQNIQNIERKLSFLLKI